jgi:molybdopterin molybdotransferase
MISVAEASVLCLAQVRVGSVGVVELAQANGRVLREPAFAERDQPPFHASAMDGYACRAVDAVVGATLEIIGEAAAGHAWDGAISAGQALRIFTGAPLPQGADRIVIQEDVTRDAGQITLNDDLSSEAFVRPAGADFPQGFELSAPRRLTPSDLALLAAMNVDRVTVAKAPKVALIATGDELVMPGATPRPDQIIASNIFALEAMITNTGGKALTVPIAPDTEKGLENAFQAAEEWGADIVVSIGGASVGDHDLLADFAQKWGAKLAFHKIAMRPGKPLIAGSNGNAAYLGLPGNPVSAIVCGHLFLLPMIRRMLGLTDVAPLLVQAKLIKPIGPNGPRAHYMRADLALDGATQVVTAFDRQDSALLQVLTNANALLLRPPHDPARDVGDILDVLPLNTHS